MVFVALVTALSITTPARADTGAVRSMTAASGSAATTRAPAARVMSPDSIAVSGGTIICEVSPYGYYQGSGYHVGTGTVNCTAVVQGIYINMFWQFSATGELAHQVTPKLCFNKSFCGVSNTYQAAAYLNLVVCAQAEMAGTWSTTACAYQYWI